MTPTEEQLACISAAPKGQSMMISAYAGCAKSSTLEMLAPGIRVPSLVLAFNKKIAQDIAQRLPLNFTTKTLNGLGHSAWQNRPEMPRLKVDDRKVAKLVSEVKPRLPATEWAWVRQLVSRAMANGLTPPDYPTDEGDGGVAQHSWEDTAATVGIPSDDAEILIHTAWTVLSRSIELAFAGTISFDDQIYMPLLFGGVWPRWPVVLVDEAQDLSPMNHRMLHRVLRPGGQLIAVGDSKQAIYAFRGADSSSMTSLRHLSKSWTDLPLTLTFRCPKEIVWRQQKHAPGFRAADGNAPGRVETWKEWTAERLTADGPMTVLCRNNAPLLRLGLRLIRKQIGISMLGRDIGKGLIALSRRLCPSDELPATDCRDRVLAYLEKEMASGRLTEATEDRTDCLLAVLDSGVATAGGLRSLLEKLFSSEGQQVLLSSIHRAKGLEWPSVVHLDPWRVPPRRHLDEVQLQQELNLRYVCETRTKDRLILANLEEMEP